MKKTINKQNKTNKFIHRLRKILNKNYFHVCITVKEDNRVEWKVYYKNLPNQAYFSNKNKALLTNDKNTIQDIYILKESFEKEKNRIFKENLREYVNVNSEAYIEMCKIKRRYSSNMINLMLLILTANIVNMFFIKDVKFSFLQLILTILLAVASTLDIIRIEKEINKSVDNIKEKFIQEKIRRQGFYFVNKLKEQMKSEFQRNNK